MVQTMLRHTIHMFNIGLIESYVENYLRFTNTQTRYSINHKSLHLLSTMFVNLCIFGNDNANKMPDQSMLCHLALQT